jgi:hypothetical protein
MTDPVAEKFEKTRLWTLLNEPDILGLSPFQWILALYPSFAWTVLAPADLGTGLIPTAIGTVLLAAFFYAACRRATAKERLRDMAKLDGGESS